MAIASRKARRIYNCDSALGIVTPWGQDSRSEAWLQEPRGRAAGAHGGPCNIARPHIYVRERPRDIGYGGLDHAVSRRRLVITSRRRRE